MTVQEKLMRRYLGRLLATQPGRAHLLGQLAEAEDSDEGAIFDALLAKVDDPELSRLIRIHQADEKRHAAMFRECVARSGPAVAPAPEETKLLAQLDVALGGFMSRPIRDRLG